LLKKGLFLHPDAGYFSLPKTIFIFFLSLLSKFFDLQYFFVKKINKLFLVTVHRHLTDELCELCPLPRREIKNGKKYIRGDIFSMIKI